MKRVLLVGAGHAHAWLLAALCLMGALGRLSPPAAGQQPGRGYESGFRYRVIGGRTWSREHHVRLVDRPVITSVDTAVWMPAYMGISEPRRNPPQTTEVTGPENGEVEVIVRSHGEVARGDVQLLKPGTRQISPKEQHSFATVDGK